MRTEFLEHRLSLVVRTAGRPATVRQFAEAFLVGDLRLVTKQPPRPGDIRIAMANVAGTKFIRNAPGCKVHAQLVRPAAPPRGGW